MIIVDRLVSRLIVGSTDLSVDSKGKSLFGGWIFRKRIFFENCERNEKHEKKIANGHV